MITIFHGDNISKSRQLLTSNTEKLQANFELIWLSGKKLKLTELEQITGQTALFQPGKALIIEKLFVGPASGEKQKIYQELDAFSQAGGEVVIWEDKALTATNLKKFSNAKVIDSPLPKLIFQFQDQLLPGNQSRLLKTLSQLRQIEADEVILALTNKRIGDLLTLSTTGGLGNQTWLANKLRGQLKHFSETKLRQLHSQLIALELEYKTGASLMSLPQLLDLWVLQI